MTMRFAEVGFAPNFVDYGQALDLQRKLHAGVVAGTEPDTVLLLEHAPVYTAGKRTEDRERPFDGTPVVSVDRGGKITWHGPGQLVGYPVLALPESTRVTGYMAILEDVIVRALHAVGVYGRLVEGRSGVWIPADSRGPTRKIAAIGIRINKRATMHGFAINCNNDLSPFEQILPCGIADAGVTTIQAETGNDVGPRDLLHAIRKELLAIEDSLTRRPADAGRPELHGVSQ